MTIAKPKAPQILLSMVAGSLFGVAALRIYDIGMSKDACEILAILFVGFLMLFASVLMRNKLKTILISVCFSASFASGALANNQLEQYPIIAYALGILVALWLCDRAIKKFT